MANINWATLGATIPAKFQDSTDQYDMNPEMFSKGMDQLGSVFDRLTREHAIDGMTKAGKQKRLQQLKDKLESLKNELAEAANANYAEQYPPVPTDTTMKVLGIDPESPSSNLGKILGFNGVKVTNPTWEPEYSDRDSFTNYAMY